MDMRFIVESAFIATGESMNLMSQLEGDELTNLLAR